MIWNELEKDHKGQVTLEAFDPWAFEAISEFRQLLLGAYGNFHKAWRALDTNGNGNLDEEEFQAACRRLGFQGDAGELFLNLLDEPCCTHLTLADIDLKAYHESFLEEIRLITGAKKKARLEQARDVENAKRKHAMDLPALRLLLSNRFGTLSAAWKHCLDRNGNGKLSFTEFCEALRGLGFRGPIRELWFNLDKDGNGQITLEEFAPEVHHALTTFADMVLKRFVDFETAWQTYFDAERRGLVGECDFVEACHELGYKEDARKLFSYLLDRPLEGSTSLSFQEFLKDLEPHHIKNHGCLAKLELRKSFEMA